MILHAGYYFVCASRINSMSKNKPDAPKQKFVKEEVIGNKERFVVMIKKG